MSVTRIERRVSISPGYGPCSACGDGDTSLKYHDHELSPVSYTLAELEQLAKQWATENEATTHERWIVSVLLAWLARKEREER